MAASWHNLVRAEACKNHVLHEVEAAGVISQIRFQSVRAAASPPGEGAGAYVVVGMLTDDVLEVAPAPLILLDEGLVESLSLDGYWDRCTDAVTASLANPLYLDIEDQGIATVFHDYQRRRGLSLDIQQAPYPNRFRLSLGTVLDWLREGRLELHIDSLVREELKSIERSALDDHPEVRWFLTRTLGFCVAAFRKFPPSRPFELGRYSGDHTHQGWMR